MSSEQAPHENQVVILGQYAGFITRLIAWLVDYVIVALVLAVLTALAGFFLQLGLFNNVLLIDQIPSAVSLVAGWIVALSFVLLYFLGFWILAGQTPGKWLMGVRIVKTNGERLPFSSALVRLLGYLLSYILFLGYLWILVDNKRQGWHDKLAGTVVVYAWPEVKPAKTLVGEKYLAFRARRQAQQQAKESRQQET